VSAHDEIEDAEVVEERRTLLSNDELRSILDNCDHVYAKLMANELLVRRNEVDSLKARLQLAQADLEYVTAAAKPRKLAEYTANIKVHVDTAELDALEQRLTPPTWRSRLLLAFRLFVVFMLIGIAAAQCGCATGSVGYKPLGLSDLVPAGNARTQAQQAVLIETGCSTFGSGVIIDATHVVTAAHVPLGDPTCNVPLLSIKDDTGTEHVAVVEGVADFDLARLRLVDDEPPLSDKAVIEAGTVAPGDKVCIESGRHRTRRCGVVTSVSDSDGGINHTVPTIHGDSGAGLYNERGQLVGIVNTCNVLLSAPTTCIATGGTASPIAPRAWLVSR
jgi:S1-C subfamily serine protease